MGMLFCPTFKMVCRMHFVGVAAHLGVIHEALLICLLNAWSRMIVTHGWQAIVCGGVLGRGAVVGPDPPAGRLRPGAPGTLRKLWHLPPPRGFHPPPRGCQGCQLRPDTENFASAQGSWDPVVGRSPTRIAGIPEGRGGRPLAPSPKVS